VDAVVADHLPQIESGWVSLRMPKAKLTDAEYNVMACFWHEELDHGFGPTLLWRLENGITRPEFFEMMHVVAMQLDAEGKNEVDLPIEPVEIPWADAREFRRRLRELSSKALTRP
jgi:hypothetical protein